MTKTGTTRGEWTRCMLIAAGFLLVSSTGADDLVSGAKQRIPRFSEHLISSEYTYPYGISAADLDRDGDLDLTSADALPHNDLYWFENDGQGNFVRHFITKDDPKRLERHVTADMNEDGFPDVIIVENLYGDLKWFQNPGAALREDRLWERRYITQGGLPGAYDVAVADLDGDKDLDVAASSWNGNQFAWFENPGLEMSEAWTKHGIDADIAETRTVCIVDLNRDGRPDVLGTARKAGLVVWYENPGKKSQPWKRTVIDQSPAPTHGHVADMDKDGDPDLVMALGFEPEQTLRAQVVWYENVGRPGKGVQWKKRVIGDGFDQAFEAVPADLDGDGHLDVVATGYWKPGRVAWFRNPGQLDKPWTMHLLKDNWTKAVQVIAADLNNDGRLDVAAVAERGSLEFRWWQNEGLAKP
jgi:FG-GAP-like repeat